MSSQDWWARKMRGELPPPRTAPIPAPVRVPAHPQQTAATVAQPPATRSGGCPSCGSQNYGSFSRGAAPRCFECSYGSPYQNSTQGLPAPNEGTATPAMQVSTGGYSPGTIVGRVE